MDFVTGHPKTLPAPEVPNGSIIAGGFVELSHPVRDGSGHPQVQQTGSSKCHFSTCSTWSYLVDSSDCRWRPLLRQLFKFSGRNDTKQIDSFGLPGSIATSCPMTTTARSIGLPHGRTEMFGSKSVACGVFSDLGHVFRCRLPGAVEGAGCF